jgi:hypothetical protein
MTVMAVFVAFVFDKIAGDLVVVVDYIVHFDIVAVAVASWKGNERKALAVAAAAAVAPDSIKVRDNMHFDAVVVVVVVVHGHSVNRGHHTAHRRRCHHPSRHKVLHLRLLLISVMIAAVWLLVHQLQYHFHHTTTSWRSG